MRRERADTALLWDMLDAARAVREFVSARTIHDYRNDRMLRGAIERHIEIIGEAASRLTEDFREAHPDIPWKKIVGQRNVLAHGNADLDHDLVWNVATREIGDLIGELERLVPDPPAEDELE